MYHLGRVHPPTEKSIHTKDSRQLFVQTSSVTRYNSLQERKCYSEIHISEVTNNGSVHFYVSVDLGTSNRLDDNGYDDFITSS
jgi:hypothetical protein